jgi:acid stress chaperone HdeB
MIAARSRDPSPRGEQDGVDHVHLWFGHAPVWTSQRIAGTFRPAEGGTFMKFIAGAVGALVIGLVIGRAPAFAESIDLSTWTCAKFQAASKDDIGVILAWMDGYYRSEDDPPVIDTEKFVANAKKLGEFCSQHPDIGIITAADEVFAK